MARGISPETNAGANLGSATQRWQKLFVNEVDAGAQVNGAFNKNVTYTSSGSFTAPVTGTYRITLVGGGGGGSGAGTVSGVHFAGAGGGQGGVFEFYETLVAGTSYSYTIGAGGTGGAAGSATNGTGDSGTAGGNTEITIGANVYTATGGYYGRGAAANFYGGPGGSNLINSIGAPLSTSSFSGDNGVPGTTEARAGAGGGAGNRADSYSGAFGAGGSGGILFTQNGTTTYAAGRDGANGYITFEYYDANA